MTNGSSEVGSEAGGGRSTPVAFYYMREGHYYRQLQFSGDSGVRCVVPEDHSSRSAILGLHEQGIDGLVRAISLIVLRLSYEKFSPNFFIEIGLEQGTRYSDLIPVGGIDLSDMSFRHAQARVRDLVNEKLTTFWFSGVILKKND